MPIIYIIFDMYILNTFESLYISMTATSDDLTMYTMGQYTVGAAATDTITSATFTQFLADAELDATTDGISSTYYDRAVTYLIADIIYSGLPGSDKVSEKIGITSYTKFDEESQWRKEYNKLKTISDASGGVIPSEMVLREDQTIVEFDTNTPITPYDTDMELV